MTKADTINGLDKIINQQSFIMTRIKNSISLNRGMEIKNIMGEENKFGEFFYNRNHRFEELLNAVFYDNISKYYEEWRNQCRKIYKIYIQDIQNPKSKLNKTSQKDTDMAKAYYDDLATIHKQWVNQCKTAFDRLHALSEDKFKASYTI